MEEQNGHLSYFDCKSARPIAADGSPRKSILLSDGNNLYLQVTAGKNNKIYRSWLFRTSSVAKRRRWAWDHSR
jgi:hypothetical protein